jgi:DNA-binding response OmpR family regulator
LASTDKRRLRALIVEDEHLLAVNLADSLGRIGLEVGGVAYHQAEALALLDREDFDIAFIDLFLDRESHGLDLARHASARSVAVVLVTGQLPHRVSDALATLRSAALLTKPFSIDQLRSVVAAVRQGMATSA